VSVSTRLRSVAAIRYVMPLREGGSLPGLVEADDDGLYVIKFRGAGQGLRALVAEVIVGALITDSGGSNLGVDFLPGALPYTPAGRWRPDPELAADVVWLDALTTNVDRTPRNPNLLIWHERLWLIDHGAALYLHHGGLDPAAHSERAFPLIGQHVLLPCAASVLEAHERLAPVVSHALLEEVVRLVPASWFESGLSAAPDGGALAGDAPQVYTEYLSRRVASAEFAAEAERARVAGA
jgi:hypothetical protein